uniref:Uncharacterized protein n=1 Tax=Zea mays TaxID=4577 RepID=A0A804UD72_MAIZE
MQLRSSVGAHLPGRAHCSSSPAPTKARSPSHGELAGHLCPSSDPLPHPFPSQAPLLWLPHGAQDFLPRISLLELASTPNSVSNSPLHGSLELGSSPAVAPSSWPWCLRPSSVLDVECHWLSVPKVVDPSLLDPASVPSISGGPAHLAATRKRHRDIAQVSSHASVSSLDRIPEALSGWSCRPCWPWSSPRVCSPIFLAASAELPSAPASQYRQVRLSQLVLVAVDLELYADSTMPNTIHVAVVRLRVMYSNITDRASACFDASSSFLL